MGGRRGSACRQGQLCTELQQRACACGQSLPAAAVRAACCISAGPPSPLSSQPRPFSRPPPGPPAFHPADPATLAGVRQCVLRTDQYLATSEFMRSLGYDVASPSREHWPEVGGLGRGRGAGGAGAACLEPGAGGRWWARVAEWPTRPFQWRCVGTCRAAFHQPPCAPQLLAPPPCRAALASPCPTGASPRVARACAGAAPHSGAARGGGQPWQRAGPGPRAGLPAAAAALHRLDAGRQRALLLPRGLPRWVAAGGRGQGCSRCSRRQAF